MLATFFRLPAELRTEIYMYLLVRSEPVDPWQKHHGLVPSLLSTNTKILHEARPLLYGHNCFNLSGWQSELIPQFLDTIGSINASHLRCICIHFPGLHIFRDKVSLDEYSLYILEKIQYHCTNLKKIIAAPGSTNIMEHRLVSLDNPKICAEALGVVDARLREILPLEEIAVKVCEEAPGLDTRRVMMSLGWTLNVVVELWEEWYWDGFEMEWDG
ncbi:hypothetical protein N7517_009707 [Penicillium concentricum]|uniref:F-box domain-containing protein n=1 Tax=Penicillium concentricum TaxID=293559 RepID=A0A9W9RI78_9EURO|nr:uncharacterized protein N7517_009707 [Penicillium concentricum]KAJ5360516.1 hypothetical protein N7517_009707 [Penicillium concentricum]